MSPQAQAERDAALLIRALPDFDWATLRHVIQAIRDQFLSWLEEDAANSEPENAPHSLAPNPPHSKDSRCHCRPDSAPPTDAPLNPNPEPRTLTTDSDLLTWSKQHLPDHFQKPPSPMHRWMADHLDRMTSHRRTKLNILGPRGGAKSTVASLAYPLREALLGREPYIWIISDTAQQAQAHLENIKAELVDNELIAKAYPKAAGQGPIWRAARIVLRNGVTIEAFGTGQRIRGRRARANRPTLIICDDLQNDRHMESVVQRSHTRTWFHGTLLKAGTPHTNVVNLATALHREALAMELTQTAGWTSKIFRSIDPWPFNTTLWEQWEQIYQRNGDGAHFCAAPEGPSREMSSVPVSRPTSTDTPSPNSTPHPLAPTPPHPKDPASPCHPDSAPPTDSPPNLNPEPCQLNPDDAGPTPTNAQQAARKFYERHQKAMNAGAAVLWPDVEDLYTLMCLRAESGRAAFEREKQNSPLNPDLCEWPDSYFSEDIWFDEWPAKPIAKVLALDPSKGGDAHRGDYSAFISLAVDKEGILYVQADMARRPTPQMVADGVEIHRQFQPHIFGVEANVFQELLAPEFESAFRRQGILGVHPWLVHNDANKRVRIRRLGPLLAGRRIRLKSDCPSTKLLLHQLQEFPIAAHDDGPDALEMALRLATELLAGRHHDDGLGNRLPVG